MTTGSITGFVHHLARQAQRVFGLDMAIVWSLIVQAALLVRAPINILFILAFLSRSEQGFWYTFSNLSALTLLADLGFTMVITQFVSHSFASAGVREAAPASAAGFANFHALVKTSVVVYALVTLIAVAALSAVGLVYFAGEPVDVRLAWLAYSLVSGARLLQGLLAAVYQGLDKVKEMQINAFWGVLGTSVVTWAVLAAGAGLWSLVIGLATGTLLAAVLLYRRDPGLWDKVRCTPMMSTRLLLRETLPLQARYAVSWISGYVLFSVAVPAAFKFVGKAEAGSLGASLAIVSVVNSVAGSWAGTKIPRMNMLASAGEEEELYVLAKHSLFRASGIHVGLSACVLVVLLAAHAVVPVFASRFLEIVPIAILLFGQLAQTIINAMAIYLRSHRRDPLMWLSVVSAALMLLNVTLVMRPFGLTAFITCECALLWGITLPLCARVFWREQRRYRHGTGERSGANSLTDPVG